MHLSIIFNGYGIVAKGVGMKVKKAIRNNLIGLYLLNQYHFLRGNIDMRLFSDEKAIIRYYKKQTGKIPDLVNPVLFSEKQQWYKLNIKSPLMEVCADKLNVRKYIKDLGYDYLLNTIYRIYDKVDDINLEALPEKFVLKATHGSGFNLIVKDKQKVNWFMWKKIMKSWLRQNIYWSGREWVYKNLQPRIISERYLEDGSGGLKDYKFYCFNGEPRFMQFEAGRYTSENVRNFYDMNWNLMPFGKEMPHNPNVNIEMPKAFEEMKKIVKDLSQPFSYVRADLYEVGGKVYFGELTFFPAGGASDFIPPVYDKIVGKMWNIKSDR